MATTQDYIEYVCERLPDCGDVRDRKMFGEYIVYLGGKTVLTVCDNTVFVKKLPELSELKAGADCGFPTEGAKEQYILDIENRELAEKLLPLVAELTPLPKPKKKKTPRL